VTSFYKMAGSGNDFVFFDARSGGDAALETPDAIRAICARGTGVGADGVVFLIRSAVADIGIRYYNADASHAALCGNATLCTVRLSHLLGVEAAPRGQRTRDPGSGLRIETDAGVLDGRLLPTGEPEFDLGLVEVAAAPVGIEPIAGELAIGFAMAGNPHLVIRVADLAGIDLMGRGAELRYHPALGPAGANVNFVGPLASGLGIRTYERGVEGETLACGTGAVAAAAVLAGWGVSSPAKPVQLVTRSGRTLAVRLRLAATVPAGGPPPAQRWLASLAGEGRLVFEGRLGG
jgi:diaminopimelate epimerase